MIVGDTAAEIRAAVGDGSRFGLEVTYIPQDAPLGLAHAVLIAADFLGDDDFVMYLGDNFIVGGITASGRRVPRRAARRPDPAHPGPRPHPFGVAELDVDGRVVGLEEKPKDPKSDLALVGVYLFTPAIHEAVRAIEPSWRGELEITDAIQWLIDQRARRPLARRSPATGRTPATSPTCWRSTASVLETLEPGVEGTVDATARLIGRVVVEAGAEVDRSADRRAGDHRRRHPRSSTPTSARSPRSPRTAGSRTARSSTPSCCAAPRIVGVRRIEASLIGRDVEVTPAPT